MKKKIKLRWLMAGIIAGVILCLILLWPIGVPLLIISGANYYMVK